MNCPSCGAPMRLEEDQECFHCEYCRSIYFPEKNEEGIRVLGEPAALACPVCRVPLVHAALSGFRMLYCNGCRGMLIRMGIFADLIQDVRAHREGPTVVANPVNEKGLKWRLACPQCHQAMDTHFYSGPGNVIMDSCSHCYLDWLDSGEFMRIVRAPDRTYGESSSELVAPE